MTAKVEKIGIILNGVTGRMGRHQHLERSMMAIIKQGGVRLSDDRVLMPQLVLTGRDDRKLKALAEQFGDEPLNWTTDISAALSDPQYTVFFDASVTPLRPRFLEMAVKAGKAIYCEKPTAAHLEEALRLAQLCEESHLPNGVVQDKLWLPGLQKLVALRRQGFFGKILSVRGEFGYWVFSGHDDQSPQRPSWNYRKADGGGIVLDMFCHWRYVLDNVFGPVTSLVVHAKTDTPQRVDEQGATYPCTAEDSAYAIFLLEDGTVCQFNSSWCVRVRRDDLLTIQVDGTEGSAVAGLRDVWVQPLSQTPRPVWNPDVPQPLQFNEHWQRVDDDVTYENAFKTQWEAFLRHVASGSAFPWTLREGAKGVQLAELAYQSWRQRKWVDVPAL